MLYNILFERFFHLKNAYLVLSSFSSVFTVLSLNSIFFSMTTIVFYYFRPAFSTWLTQSYHVVGLYYRHRPQD